MFRFAIFALAISTVFGLNLKYGNDPSQSLCGDINGLFDKITAVVDAPPSNAAALAAQFVAPNFQRMCSQGGCVYEGSFQQMVMHLVRDNFVLTSWSMSNVQASYGDYYTKGIGKLRIENKCGDVYNEVSEFAFYCTDATAPGRASQLHIMRTEAPFKLFVQKTMICAQSLVNAQSLRGAAVMDIPKEHFSI